MFAKFHRFKVRKENGDIHEGNEKDRVWMSVNALSTRLGKPLAPILTISPPGTQTGRKGRRDPTRVMTITDPGRVLTIAERDEFSLDYQGEMHAIRRLPSEYELNEAAKGYTSKEEAMPHARVQCKYHQDVIRGTKAYKDHIKNGTKTEEEMFEGLHNTQACLAFQ